MTDEELEKAAQEKCPPMFQPDSMARNVWVEGFEKGVHYVLEHFKGYAACANCGAPPRRMTWINQGGWLLECCGRKAQEQDLEAARLAWNNLQREK